MLLFHTSFQVAGMQGRAISLEHQCMDNISFASQNTVSTRADSAQPDTVLSSNSLKIAPPDSVNIEDNGKPTSDPLATKVDSVLLQTTSNSLFAPSYLFKPSPTKSVLYSAFFPGMGQIYNRKYWKLPIVYGGFVGFTYAITWNNGYYRDYLGAYQDIMDDNPETNRWHNMLPYGMQYETVDQSWFKGVLQQRKDYYRYYRDLSIILTVGWYMLAIVDAYVDAQLFDFDMSADLSLRMGPTIFRDDNSNYSRNSYGLQWSLQF